MFSPEIIMIIFSKIEELFVFFRFWKKSEERKVKINQFLAGYRETVYFLKTHKKLIVVTIVCTFVQRFSVFVLTYVVYRGLGLNGFAMIDVVLLQASVYIAVDMFPIPGAQGITEAIYKKIFRNIFPRQYLIVSMCITRGISFYFIMIVGFGVWAITYLKNNRKSE